MLEGFIIKSIIAGLGVGIAASIIGCFLVWRKMSYFSDALAHSSLLGVGLSFLITININLSVLIVGFIFAIMIMILEYKKLLAYDSILAVLSYSFLALGIVIIDGVGLIFDLHSYLFGDILTVTNEDIYLIYISLLIIIAIIATNWNKFVLLVINEEMAKSENINALTLNILFMLVITILVTISLKIIGALLIGALLIIPSATARFIGMSLITMMMTAIVITVAAILSGIYLSLHLDTPTGPIIVVTLGSIFFITLITHSVIKYYRGN